MNTILTPRLLIADSCPDNRWSLAYLARQDGCEVHTAGSPAETLLLTSIIRPGVLLIDVMMPRADVGYGVIEDLRRVEWCPEILIATGYWCPEHATRCADLGAMNVLKPYCHRTLLTLVQKLAAERERCRSAAPLQSSAHPPTPSAFQALR